MRETSTDIIERIKGLSYYVEALESMDPDDTLREAIARHRARLAELRADLRRAIISERVSV
jgi:hypothetical protein